MCQLIIWLLVSCLTTSSLFAVRCCRILVLARRVLSLLMLQLDHFLSSIVTESVESAWLVCLIGSRALNLPYPQLHQYQGWLSFGLLGLRVLASFELIRQRRSFLFLACVIHIAVISCSSRCYGVYARGWLLKFVYRSVWRNHSVIVGSLVIWIIRFCVKNSFIAYVRHYFMSRIFMYGR